MTSLSFWGRRASTEQQAPASVGKAEDDIVKPAAAPVPAAASGFDGGAATTADSAMTESTLVNEELTPSRSGWLSSISSYIGSSIASVASPNASHDDADDDYLNANGDLALPRGEELADIAEGDEDDAGDAPAAGEAAAVAAGSKGKALPTVPAQVKAANGTQPAAGGPHYKTDDKGRKLLVPGPKDPPSTDPLEQNRAPRELGASPIEVTDPAAATQGYSDPAIFPNGSSFTSSNKPLNVIISNKSSPDVLTRKGLQSYLRSINFDFECLNLHSGGPQYATIDPTGAQPQIFEYREVFTPLDHIVGTCIESLQGGNHVRGYMQAGTDAWFLAVSKEEDVTKQHIIIPDGYNIGRDDFVNRSQSQSNGQTDFFFQVWKTTVEYATNLMAAGTNANHDITVDGKVAVLTVTLVSTLGVPTPAAPATGSAAPSGVVATPAPADGTADAPVAPTPISAVPAAAGGAVAAAATAATAPEAAAPAPADAPVSRKSTDRQRPIKRFSMQLRRRLSGQVSKADAEKLAAEVKAAEDGAGAGSSGTSGGNSKKRQSISLGRASTATERPDAAALAAEAAPPSAAPTDATTTTATTEAPSPATTPLEVPKLKRRESQLKKVFDRLQPRKPSSSSPGSGSGEGARVTSGSSARVVSGALPAAK